MKPKKKSLADIIVSAEENNRFVKSIYQKILYWQKLERTYEN